MPARPALVVMLGLAVVAARAEVRATPPQSARTEADASTIRDQIAAAERLLREQKGNQARPLLDAALARAIDFSLESEEAAARAGIGESLYYQTRYEAAREQGLMALEIYERLADPHGIGRASHLLSLAAHMSGARPEARSRAERAVAAFDAANDRRGHALATLQLIRVASLALSEERTLYGAVIADARAIGDPILEGRALHSMGDHLFVEGLYEESLDMLMRAEAVLSATSDAAALGTVYNSIGRVYRAHGRLDEALKFQLRALALHQKAGAPFELLQSLNAVATVYQRVGDLRAARGYYEQALTLAEKSSSPRVQDLVRANLAGLLLDQGQFAAGAAALERVIANGVDAYPAERYSSLSFAYVKMARPRDALDAAMRAVEACAHHDDICTDALQRRAAAHAALGEADAALSDVNAALAHLEAIRARLVPADFFRRDFNRVRSSVYSQAIALQVQQGQAGRALETAERARSRAFLDLLASRDISPSDATISARPDYALLPEPELRGVASALPSAVDDLVKTAERLRSTLVAYWVGEDEVFIWVVTRAGAVHVRRVPVLQSKLQELVRRTTPLTGATGPSVPDAPTVATRGASAFALRATEHSAWRELYDLLVQPVRSLLPPDSGALLTLVPHGPLLGVSFAALQSPQGRYLLEDYTVHYAPAGAVLQFTAAKRRADARTGAALIVADPALPHLTALDRPLPRLPGARREAAAISRLMPGGRATVLQDRVATETAIRRAVAGKAVLHFATHAVVSDEDPFRSFLVIGPSSPGDNADGLLTAREVYALDLHADLVVLSACQSAGGRVTGDGISAFARAFIYAGAASLVASLWDVADEPTNRLLPEFYRRWLGGVSKSRALRDAQLGLLRELRAGHVRVTTAAGVVSIPEHPVFWAGFALAGEPD